MKISHSVALAMALFSSVAVAKRGDGTEDGDRTITCSKEGAQHALLQFQGLAGVGKYEDADFSLLVQSRGDDVGQIILTDKKSGDSVKSFRAEEILTVTLTTDENPASPKAFTSSTRKGLATVSLVDEASGDAVSVTSLERRSQSSMNVKLTTDEAPDAPISVTCLKN